MRTKPYIRFSKSGQIDGSTMTHVIIQLTGLGKTEEGKSYQINQSAVTPIQTYVLYWKVKDGCNAIVEAASSKGRPTIGSRSSEEIYELNQTLLEINHRIAELCDYIKIRFSQTPNTQIKQGWLKGVITDFYTPKEEVKSKPVTLFQYIDEFLRTASLRKDVKTGKYIDNSTVVKYRTSYKLLQQFATYSLKSDFLFEELNMGFYDRYVDFLESRGYTANTVGRAIKELKAILSQATKDGVNTSLQYKDFKVLTEDIDNVYLNEEELNLIRRASLSETPLQIEQLYHEQSERFDMELKSIVEKGGWHTCPKMLRWVRDMFLLLAWTGSRFSDLDKINIYDKDSNLITFRQQKTNTRVVIPIHPVVQEILERYNFRIEKQISNQKFNDYIKVVCLLAGIDTPTTITRTKGGHRVTKTVPKWLLVSSHTGRRSFCTNQYLRNIPIGSIMAVSGHRTEKSFLKYIKADKEEHAQRIMELWQEIYR